MEFSPPLVPNMNLIKDEITSSLMSAQVLEFSESELFPETIQNSEVGSSSNCGYEENSSYSTNLPLTPDMNTFNGGADTKDDVAAVNQASNPAADDNNNHISIIFDAQEDIDNDLSASIDFGPGGAENFSLPPQFLHHPNQLDQFDISSLDVGRSGGDGSLAAHHQQYPSDQQMVQLMGPPPPPQQQQQQIVYEDECLSSVPSYLRLTSSSPSCSLLDPTLGSYLPPGNLNPALSADNSGVFTGGGGFFLGADLPPQDLEFQGDNSRVFCHDNIPRVYNCANDQFQTLSSESQHLVSGAGSSTPLTSDITCLEDTTFKVGKLSVEERKEKIHRYLKKRNERNFSKKIKYACRKTLADSRPRVRGRFAKNDDFGDVTVARASMGNHEDDTAVDEAARHNFLYDPNNYHTAAAAAALSHGGRIFNSNCLAAAPGPGPYDMCTTLFCADANMH